MLRNLIAKRENNSRKGLFSSRSRRASVRNQRALNDAITLETLERRQLMTVLSVTDFGAATNGSGNDQAAVQAALNAAKPGDTVSFPSGTYNFSGSVSIPTGVTVTGMSNGSSHINFNLSGQDLYGFKLNGNDSNVTIENLDIVSNHGIVSMQDGSGYNNITITNNRLEYGGGSTAAGIDVMGIEVTINNNNTQITNNYFHDSPNSNRNWVIYFASNSNFDHNTFYNINDGGQLEYMGANDSFSYNYGTYLHRMGQETAGSSSTVNFKVDGNVFYDYVSPYNDTEGVSICVYGTNTQIENNYFDANIAPGSSWGQQSGAAAGGPNRFGYAIESSGFPGTVSGNTLVGNWAEDVSVMGAENVTGNEIYGSGLWGDIENEPGPNGFGSLTQSNNLEDSNINDAPPPPANTNSYLGVSGSNATGSSTTTTNTPTTTTSSGNTGSTTTTTTTTTTSTNSTGTTATLSGVANGITGLTANVLSDNSVQLSWTASNVTLSSATVQITTTVGRQSFPAVLFQGNVDSATILQLHAGWQYDFTIVGTTSTGATVSSQVATIRTTGNSTAAYALSPTAGTCVLVSPPPATGTGSSTSTGTTSTGTTSTGTTSTATITAATATVLSDNSVSLSWTNPNVTLTSASIQIITTVGRQTFPAVVVNGNVSTATIGQLHAGWQYDFTIVGTTSTGATVTSNVITVSTTGNSTPAYALAPVAVPPEAPAPVVSGSAAVSGLTATALSNTSVQLSWTNQNVTLTSAMVNVITTVGRQSYAGIAVTGDADGVIITGLHAGWEFDFSITGTASDGSIVTSTVATVATTGGSTSTPPVLGTLNFASLLLAA
jgi:hypothetical protein